MYIAFIVLCIVAALFTIGSLLLLWDKVYYLELYKDRDANRITTLEEDARALRRVIQNRQAGLFILDDD